MAEEQERTEEASQQRREDFRRRGQVAQTRELGSAIVLLFAALSLWFFGKFFLTEIFNLFSNIYHQIPVSGRQGDVVSLLSVSFQRGALIILPIASFLFFLTLVASVMQVGFLNNEEALDFNWDRVNPVEGFKRLFAFRSIVEGIKSTLKLLLVSAVAYWLIASEFQKLQRVMQLSSFEILNLTGSISFHLFIGLGLLLGCIALLDYFYQRWELERQMRMTKQEVKEEHKSREGDPLVKARIRRIQRDLANKRMMTDVPKADVIITNPTHIACALKYDAEKMAAPQLVAKGTAMVAERIKQIARDHNIPIIENKPLARTIFKTLKIGQIIPRELFAAVAQVLSYVYKLRRKAAL